MKLLNRSAFAALLTLFTAAMLFTMPAKANNNPFASQDIVASSIASGGDKCGEGKCGGKKDAEGKCGEGKCGSKET